MLGNQNLPNLKRTLLHTGSRIVQDVLSNVTMGWLDLLEVVEGEYEGLDETKT
jgi:hypothetical protein